VAAQALRAERSSPSRASADSNSWWMPAASRRCFACATANADLQAIRHHGLDRRRGARDRGGHRREERLLSSSAAPIVLLRARADTALIATGVARPLRDLGVMLPATPLHHLLMRELGFPVVATTATAAEPIVIDEMRALEILGSIADLFLVHDRPILRPIDDSVVRIIAVARRSSRQCQGLRTSALRRPVWRCPAQPRAGRPPEGRGGITTGGDIVSVPISRSRRRQTRAALAEAIEGRSRSIVCSRSRSAAMLTRIPQHRVAERLGLRSSAFRITLRTCSPA